MTDASRKETAQPADWSPCETGVLAGLSERLHKRHAREQTAKIGRGAAVAACALLLAFGVGVSWGGRAESIDCSECMAMMPAYEQSLVADGPMNAGDREAVAAHLAQCPKCRGHFESTYPGVLSGVAAAAVGLWFFALVPLRVRG